MQASRLVGSQDLYLKTSEGAAFAARPVPRSKTINNEITTHLKAPPRHNIHIYSSLRSPSPVLNAPNYFNSVRKTESERKRESEREGGGVIHIKQSLPRPHPPMTSFLVDNSATLASAAAEKKKKGKMQPIIYALF